LYETFKTTDKSTVFIQRSLRSGLDILKNGGSVTPVYKDKILRMFYDNRRIMGDNYSIVN
jgi:hypothetical protein